MTEVNYKIEHVAWVLTEMTRLPLVEYAERHMLPLDRMDPPADLTPEIALAIAEQEYGKASKEVAWLRGRNAAADANEKACGAADQK